jgi:hypothetical protein
MNCMFTFIFGHVMRHPLPKERLRSLFLGKKICVTMAARLTLALVLFGAQVTAFVPQARTFGLTCDARTACATELFGVVDFFKNAFGGAKRQEANNVNLPAQEGPAELIVTNPAPPLPEPAAKTFPFAKKNVEEGNLAWNCG